MGFAASSASVFASITSPSALPGIGGFSATDGAPSPLAKWLRRRNTTRPALRVAAQPALSVVPVALPTASPVIALPAPPTRPLRVLRVIEGGEARQCAGRMVISGRMADVCAELDRLAAREAQRSERVLRAN